MAAQTKVYVVWQGRKPGIYRTWAECQAQVKGFAGAKHKAFPSLAAAQAAYGPGLPAAKQTAQLQLLPTDIDPAAICVDAACAGNPGPLEYRGVRADGSGEVFQVNSLYGTNNVGEFLAVVHALAMLKQQGSAAPIYTDSRTALGWVRNRRCGSTLVRTEKTAKAWALIDRAVAWLQANDYANPVLKWNTARWGEIPADYGRK